MVRVHGRARGNSRESGWRAHRQAMVAAHLRRHQHVDGRHLQYGWTLFVDPINDKHHWGRAAIQVAFTIFVLVETWLVPLEGYLVDRFGPTFVGAASGVLVAGAWVLNSAATSLPMLYLGAVIGGVAVGGGDGAPARSAPQWVSA